MRSEVTGYIKKKYKADPEYLWKRYPDYAVFRHSDNRKWFGIIMNISYEKIDSEKSGMVDILNVKLEDILMRDYLVSLDGYYPGYHISRGNWISIALDGTVPFEAVCELIDIGFSATASKKKKKALRQPKEWLIPSNPKYYDIIHAFDDTDTIDWKQGAGIIKNDIVYIYVGAPVSAIMYRCKVLETDIPYNYHSDGLTIKALMKIKLLKRYEADQFTFERLKTDFGVFAVRGPRGVPNSLSALLK
ncbi:MAG: MmcQ/YjbR family DNA-binding protein [Oscillospiraceae bacterium]|nr:MmcQ/YjbR family DNA-binding protein [Oscillospiraceae bacterium]MBR3536628.1 MmcQ/YjbR family DNA-binding protein [Oscillospiraceae bacterium]